MRIVAVLALGLLVMGCGGPPKETVRIQKNGSPLSDTPVTFNILGQGGLSSFHATTDSKGIAVFSSLPDVSSRVIFDFKLDQDGTPMTVATGGYFQRSGRRVGMQSTKPYEVVFVE